MASFLTNPKMSAALATRVQSSVRGLRPGQRQSLQAPTRTALLRLSIVALLAVISVLVWLEFRTRAQQLATAKSRLTNERAELRATLTPNAYTLSERVMVALRRESNIYAGSRKTTP